MSNITQSVSNNIKQQLKVKIAALPSVEKTYGYEEPEPSGFPAVFIVAGDMVGEFSSNAEDSRIYSYEVLIIFPSSQNLVPDDVANKNEYAEQIIATVVDEMINTIDTDFELPNSDPTVLFVNAADCTWGKYNLESGVAKAALVNFKVYTELTIR